ncbi:MAG: hypothetical protein ACE5JU_25340 [Candidatus Binatia bacterium]
MKHILLLLACFAALMLTSEPVWPQFDRLERLLDACSRGDQKACQELEPLKALNRQADAFSRNYRNLGIQSEKIPDLRKAYPLVLRDYLASRAARPVDRRLGLKEDLLAPCSEHFHDFWINQRKEWPTAPSGEPDWHVIYLQILDHYFSFCTKR